VAVSKSGGTDAIADPFGELIGDFCSVFRGVDHAFECYDSSGPISCGSGAEPRSSAKRTVYATHFAFDAVPASGAPFEMYDTTSITIEGVVEFPLAHRAVAHGAAPPGETGVDLDYANDDVGGSVAMVPIAGAEICVRDHTLNELTIACATTNSAGRYQLAVAPGTRASFLITKGTHTYFRWGLISSGTCRAKVSTDCSSGSGFSWAERDENSAAASSGAEVASASGCVPPTQGQATGKIDVFHITEKNRGKFSGENGLDFVDRTTRPLKLDAHGTLCQLQLGASATFRITHPSLPTEFIEPNIATPSYTDGTIIVPAQLLDVALIGIAPDYPQVTDMGELGYHHRMRDRTKRLDLYDALVDSAQGCGNSATGGGAGGTGTSPSPTMYSLTWKYHPPPDIELAFITVGETEDEREELQEYTCSSPSAG
jgi:hypothetical protein